MATQCFICCIPIPILLTAVFMMMPRMRVRLAPLQKVFDVFGTAD